MADSKTLRTTPVVAVPGPLPGARRPVVVVDPEPGVRRVVSLVLQGAGWDVRTAADAEEALPMVRASQPALVIAELRLAGAGGLELAQQIRDGGGWQPRIALTSVYPRPREAADHDFLRKPLDFDRLLALMDSVDEEMSGRRAYEG